MTISGCQCSATSWQAVDSDPEGVFHSGCANPDGDPNGAWCNLVRGTTSPTGQTWDYCQPSCTDPTGEVVKPKQVLYTEGPSFHPSTCRIKGDGASVALSLPQIMFQHAGGANNRNSIKTFQFYYSEWLISNICSHSHAMLCYTPKSSLDLFGEIVATNIV